MNIHEKTEGVFDFSGEADLGRFIDLASELGLKVIVRGGPYICAEWEGGGLPAWLLSYPDIQLRTCNELYLSKVELYLENLFAVVKPRLISNGGNVIMMQVENEYGTFGNDRKYLEKIRSIYDKNGEEDKITFKLNKGKKQVVIYLPIDMIFAIKDFCLDGHYQPVSKRETKVLWIGDSITQGYGSAYTSHSYVNVANRRLGYELLNQGIGGYYYDCNIIQPMPDFSPDKIIVSLGINGHVNTEKEKMINDYYKALVHLYPNIPILSITPLWAKADWIDMQGVLDTAKFIRNNAKMYPQISVLDGFELVPHLSEYFIDGVHPNTLGMALYAYNLVKEIESIGF